MSKKKEVEKKPCPMINFMALLEKLVDNSDINPEIISKLIGMNDANMDRRARVAYNEAMARVQGLIHVVPKDMENEQTGSKYSSYESLMKYAKPIYTREGFSLVFGERRTSTPENICIQVSVLHSAGHSEVLWVDIPMDDKGIQGKVNKTRTHAKGSSISYARGYLMRMVFNMSTGEDDDGNGASGDLNAITPGQAENISVCRQAAGLSVMDFQVRLQNKYHTADVNNLTSVQADEVIAALQMIKK